MFAADIENHGFDQEVDKHDSSWEDHGFIVCPKHKVNRASQQIGVDEVLQLAIVDDLVNHVCRPLNKNPIKEHRDDHKWVLESNLEQAVWQVTQSARRWTKHLLALQVC